MKNRPFFLSFQTEWKNESYLIQWHTNGIQNIKSVSLYSKSVSHENSKCLHFASLQIKPIVQKRPFFLSSQTEWKKWVIFDTMAYQRLLEYQTSFHLLKLSEPWKFQMSSFCISSDKNIVQNRPFFFHSKQNEKISHIWHNGIPKTSRISNLFAFTQSQWAVKIPNIFILHQYRWNT